MEKRAEFGMTYDSKRDRIITFGGPAGYPGGGPTQSNWTWAFDLDNMTWSNLTTGLALSPPPTGVCCIAYDLDSDRTILWRPGSNDVWALDLANSTWELRSPPTPRPPDGASYSLGYDSLHDRTLVTVFPWGPGAYRQTWAYDYDTNVWQRRAQTGPIPANDTSGGAIPWSVYDSESDRTIIYMDDQVTWAYNWTADQWYDAGAIGPVGHHFTFVYVPDLDVTLFYGGAVGNNRQTWVYELNPSVDEKLSPFGIGVALSIGVAAVWLTRTARIGRSRRR